jgi:hypothetical protein
MFLLRLVHRFPFSFGSVRFGLSTRPAGFLPPGRAGIGAFFPRTGSARPAVLAVGTGGQCQHALAAGRRLGPRSNTRFPSGGFALGLQSFQLS